MFDTTLNYTMMKSKFKTLLLLILWANLSFAQKNMSLDEAIQYALEHNSSIKNAQINIADAEGVIVENTAIGLPHLDLGADYNYFPKLPTTQIPAQFFDPMAPDGEFASVTFGLKQNFNANLSLSWLALDGTYFYGLRAAKLYRDLEKQNYVVTQKNVRDDVTNAYLPALILAENLKILDKNIANLEKLYTETQAMYKEGFVERLDVSRLELSLSNLKNEKDNLIRQQQTILNVLKFQIGYPIEQDLNISDDINRLFVEAAPEELTKEINVETRPEYKSAELGIQLNELNIKRYKAGYLPSLRIMGSYQQTWQGDKFSEGVWFPTTLVGANISMPIFDGFQKKGAIQRANLELERAKLQIRDLERGISLEVENARTTYQNARQRLYNQENTLTLAEQIFNDSKIKYQEGVGSSLELNQAEQALYDSQRNRIQAMYDLLVAKKGLEQAVGRIDNPPN